VEWFPNCPVTLIREHPGSFSGWLMVLPNAVMAFYYGWRGQPETVYASQVGDCHVSIPLCLGVYTLFHTMTFPLFYNIGIWILLISTLMHIFFVITFGRLPRLFGVALFLAYVVFLLSGVLG
jgi:cation:H+ antiporter